MNKFSRIRHHVDMKDVKKRHLEESVAKKIREKQIEEEKRIQKEIYDAWKSDWRQDIIDEGMTTNMLTGILPSAGNADLEVIETGLTGDGLINYGQPGLGDETMESDDSEYTCFTNLDNIDNAEDLYNTGTRIRLLDQETRQFRGQLHGGGAHGYLPAIPGYVEGMMRNVKPTGDYNAFDKAYRTREGLPILQGGSELYYHLYGKTNDELGKGFGSWNSTTGLQDAGFGTALMFNGPGSPRYIALKPVDSTGFDTIKLHAAINSNHIVGTTRDSEFQGGTLRDKRVQVYYWAGNHKDYKRHSSASTTYQGHNNKFVSGDGWRPINMKPNGDFDDTVDPYIIKHAADRDTEGVDALGATYSASSKLHPYSIPLPEYTRGKNARYLIIQVDKTSSQDSFALASVRFQRKNTLRVPSISKPLTDIEAAPFVRVGQGVGDKNAEQRRKRVRDMIKASLKYGQTKFGDGVVTSTNID